MDPEEERAPGRARFLAGELAPESPLVEGGRWGIGAVLRPTGLVGELLAGLARDAGAVAGPGHWVHGEDVLHATILTIESHRVSVPAEDPRVLTYARALADATAGVSRFRMRVHGLSPHPGGVAAAASPCDRTPDAVRRRLSEAVQATHSPRTWYLNLVHFAAEVLDRHKLAAWCDEQSREPIGTMEVTVAELVRWRWAGSDVSMSVLHRCALSP